MAHHRDAILALLKAGIEAQSAYSVHVDQIRTLERGDLFAWVLDFEGEESERDAGDTLMRSAHFVSSFVVRNVASPGTTINTLMNDEAEFAEVGIMAAVATDAGATLHDCVLVSTESDYQFDEGSVFAMLSLTWRVQYRTAINDPSAHI